MAKRTSEPVTAITVSGVADEKAQIRNEIERTRGDMSRTVNEIEERLSPAHIKEQIASVTAGVQADIEHKVADLKDSVLGQYHEMKDHLKDDIRGEISGAKHMVSDEISHARAAVREATVGRVEHMVHDVRHMAHDARESVTHMAHDARESVTDAGSSVLATIKANPIPTALIGLGLGWLIFGARKNQMSSAERTMSRYRRDSGDVYGYNAGYGYAEGREGNYAYGRGTGASRDGGARGALRQGQRAVGNAVQSAEQGVANAAHRVQDTASDVGHRVSETANHLVEGAQGVAHDVSERVGHMAHDAGHAVGELAGEARDRAMHLAQDARRQGRRVVRGAGRNLRRAEQGIEATMRQNPLALGAVAIAVGAAIGLALPHTHVEDEWMGETKERLIRRAEGVAGEAIHRAEDAVGQLTAGQQDKGSDKADSNKASDTKNGLPNGLSGSHKSKSQAV